MPVTNQGRSGEADKLSNFFLRLPSDFLPVLPGQIQLEIREQGSLGNAVYGSQLPGSTEKRGEECGIELDGNKWARISLMPDTW